MIGLVLSGGGARGAYQVGVLVALADIATQLKIKQPFKIYTGVSAGSINATYMASGADDFARSAHGLAKLWSSLTSDKVFKTDAVSIGKIGLRWMGELSFGGMGAAEQSKALLDTSPLHELLITNMQSSRIQEHVDSGLIRALAITALDYQTSTAITFVQGKDDLPSWKRARRRSERATLTAEHVMASSAIPALFPPVNVGNRWYGDGCLRNMAPCSPALHLGAEKLVIVGVRRLSEIGYTEGLDVQTKAPSAAKVFNVLLNSVLLDGIELDIERLNRINEFLTKVPSQDNLNFKPVDYVWIKPSGDIGKLALSKANRMPRIIRYLLKGLGPLEDASEIISYLMFEPEFCAKLIEMGYEDGMKSKDELSKILLEGQ